jgi:small-conductance mechanosensitive channel
MMSGFVITYSRALKPGDWVRIGETVGEVRAVGVLSTKILTPTRELVTIPNAVLVGDRVINYTPMAAADGAVLSTAVTIGYDAPWRQVHRLLLGAAAAVPRLRTDPAPFVLQTSLSDFYVSYELRAHHDRPEERPRILSELHAAIQDAFNEAGVQIMSPNFEAQPASPVLVPKDRWEGTPPDGAPRKV